MEWQSAKNSHRDVLLGLKNELSEDLRNTVVLMCIFFIGYSFFQKKNQAEEEEKRMSDFVCFALFTLCLYIYFAEILIDK